MSSERYPRKKPNILLISLGKRVLDCAIIQEINFRFKRFFMPLSLQEVQRIAELARIGVSDAEARAVQSQLNDIFKLIGRMQKVDTEGIEPMSHGGPRIALARGHRDRARPAGAIPIAGAGGGAGTLSGS